MKEKSAVEKIFEAEEEMERITKGKKGLNEEEHKELRKSLKNRADALSEYYGVKIHSLFVSIKERGIL